MLLDFHDRLRKAGLQVSLNEWLTLLRGLQRGIGTLDIDRFYVFALIQDIKDIHSKITSDVTRFKGFDIIAGVVYWVKIYPRIKRMYTVFFKI